MCTIHCVCHTSTKSVCFFLSSFYSRLLLLPFFYSIILAFHFAISTMCTVLNINYLDLWSIGLLKILSFGVFDIYFKIDVHSTILFGCSVSRYPCEVSTFFRFATLCTLYIKSSTKLYPIPQTRSNGCVRDANVMMSNGYTIIHLFYRSRHYIVLTFIFIYSQPYLLLIACHIS